MKRFLKSVVASLLVSSVLFGCGNAATATSGDNSAEKTDSATTKATAAESTTSTAAAPTDISIGVSIWGTTDPLGASVKKILDAEAESLGIKLVYSETALKSEEVVSSVENLCASGVQGIVICNSADAEMAKAIPTCEKNHVYLAQYFRVITDDQVLQIADQSKYFLGETHEDEVENGYNLCKILVEKKGCRNIGMMSYRVGDATAAARIQGYQKYVQEWNAANANDQVVLGDVVDDKYTADESRQAVESMIDANSKMDGLVVVTSKTDVSLSIRRQVLEVVITGEENIYAAIRACGSHIRTCETAEMFMDAKLKSHRNLKGLLL
jgi:ribose transport system substrate-binding protein